MTFKPTINLDAEYAFLGALLINGDQQLIFVPKLSENEFYDPLSRKVVKLMIDHIVSTHRPFSIVDAPEDLKIPMTELIAKSSLTNSFESTLHLIWDNHTNNLARECGMTIEQFATQKEMGQEYFTKMQNILNDYSKKLIRKDGFKTMPEILDEWFQAKIKKHETNAPYKLPFAGLDYLEISNGHLATVIARPKSGKTTFLTQIALDCVKKNQPVLVFTLEDTKEGIMDKLIALQMGMNLKVVQEYGKPGFIDTANIEARISKAVAEIENAQVGFVDGVGIGLGEIRAVISRFAKEHPDAVVIIDQLQHIKHQEYNKIIKYDAIVENLKNLAQEFQVKIILAAQLNRDIERDAARFPAMSDIKDCGRIEEGSDLAILFAKEKQTGDADRLCTVVSRHYQGRQARLKWTDKLVKFATV